MGSVGGGGERFLPLSPPKPPKRAFSQARRNPKNACMVVKNSQPPKMHLLGELGPANSLNPAQIIKKEILL